MASSTIIHSTTTSTPDPRRKLQLPPPLQHTAPPGRNHVLFTLSASPLSSLGITHLLAALFSPPFFFPDFHVSSSNGASILHLNLEYSSTVSCSVALQLFETQLEPSVRKPSLVQGQLPVGSEGHLLRTYASARHVMEQSGYALKT